MGDEAKMPDIPADTTPAQFYEEFMVKQYKAREEEAKAQLAEADIDIKLSFVVEGDGGGTWTMHLSAEGMEMATGEDDEAQASIIMDIEDWKGMFITRELNPQEAFMSGKIRIDGDMSVLMQLQTVGGMGMGG